MSPQARLVHVLVLLGIVCLALTAYAEPQPGFYIGYNPALAKVCSSPPIRQSLIASTFQRQVVRGQSYDITWGGTYVTYVDVYLEYVQSLVVKE
jgi:hypothetical protein